MGLISKIAALKAIGRPVYRLFRTTQVVAETAGVDVPLLDRIEAAIEEAQEYGDAFGATGPAKLDKAAGKVKLAFDFIDRKRGLKVIDKDLNNRHMRDLTGLIYDIAQNREANDDKLAPQ